MNSTIEQATHLFAARHKEINTLLELLTQQKKPSKDIVTIQERVGVIMKGLEQDAELFLDRHPRNEPLSILLGFKKTVISVTEILRSKEDVLSCLKCRIIRVTRDNSISIAIGGFFTLQKNAMTTLASACQKTISTLLQSSNSSLLHSPKERFSPDICSYLVSQLDSVELPSYDLRVSVAHACDLSVEQVNGWIYNRRSRYKRRPQRLDRNNSSTNTIKPKPDDEKGAIIIKPHDVEPYQDFQQWLSCGFFRCFTVNTSDALNLLQTISPFTPGAHDELLNTTACLLIPKEVLNTFGSSSSSKELSTLLASDVSATHMDHVDSKLPF